MQSGWLSGLTALLLAGAAFAQSPLTATELGEAKRLALSALPPLPQDPTNRFASDPKVAELGKALFFDTRLSANGQIACASCHQPDQQFQDGLPLAFALGLNIRRTMPLAGAQWGPWFFWDGRKDSQWSQALEPFESPAEHGLTRADITQIVLSFYRQQYEAVFGPAPDTAQWPLDASPLLPGEKLANWQAAPEPVRNAIDGVYANIGKAIAAYERTLLPAESRFDRFVAAIAKDEEPSQANSFTNQEIEGLQVFIGKGRCIACHSGARLTDDFFHNTGVAFSPDVPGIDFGRALILDRVVADPFNCAGPHSDAPKEHCKELRFMSKDPKVFEGAFKTPTLRGVASRPPYMHAGQILTLEAVVDHYDAAPDPFSDVPDIYGSVIDHGRHSQLQPLALTAQEKAALVAFLKTL